MPARGAKTVAKTTVPRLPPLPRLKIKHPNGPATANPCQGIMSSVLACWASSGHFNQACAQLEQSLRACMDAPKPTVVRKNNINYHLSRFYKQMVGPRKKD